MIGIGQNDFKLQPSVLAYSSGASLEFDFTNGSAHPIEGNAALVVTRAGDTGTRVNSAGVIETVAANMARLTHDPSVLRFENMLLWSEDFSNAAWGATNLTVSPNTGLAPDCTLTADRTVESSGAVDPRFPVNVTLVAGQAYTLSAHGKESVGSSKRYLSLVFNSGFSAVQGACFDLATGAVTATAGGASASVEPLPNGGWRVAMATIAATGGGASLRIRPSFYNTAANLTAPATYAGDGTSGLYIWGAQLNTGPTALEYKRTGATAFAKWYACKGLLAEDAAINTLRNNTMVGAVVGSPGTMPTNWTIGTVAGIATSVVSSGSEDGIDCIDLRWSGTATATGSLNIYFETATGVVAATGQVWAISAHMKRQAGSNSGINNFNFVMDENTAAGAFVTNGVGNITAPGGSSLATQRPSYIRTLAGGGTIGCVRPYLNMSVTNGAVIDITLRIGLPQLERDKVTSVIKTSGAAVTRNADVPLAMVNPDQFNDPMTDEAKCTVLVKYTNGTKLTGTRALSFRDSGGTNQLSFVSGDSSGLGGYVNMFSAGSVIASLPSFPPAVAGATNTLVIACETNNFAGSRNGDAAATDSLGIAPSLLDRLHIGCDSSGAQQLNGTVKRVAVWGLRRKSNADIAQMST